MCVDKPEMLIIAVLYFVMAGTSPSVSAASVMEERLEIFARWA